MAQKELHLSENALRKIAEVVMSKLEKIDGNWQQPWLSQVRMLPPRNLYSPTPLRGMNEMLMSMLCEMKDWKTPFFLTFNQITNKEGKFKYKDLKLNFTTDADGKKHYEESFPVIKWVLNYYNPEASPRFIQPREYDMLDEGEKEGWRPIFNKKIFNEFNLEQTNFPELYPEEFKHLAEQCTPDSSAFVHTENCDNAVLNEMIVNNNWITNAIHLEGSQAYFRPSTNEIWLPPRETFKDSSSFFTTAMHEMVHSEGPVLGRDLGGGHNSSRYGMEELVAEFGAAVIAMQLGIEKTIDEEHLQYLKCWIDTLHKDPSILEDVVNDVMKASNFFLRHYEQVEKDLANGTELPKYQYGDYTAVGIAIEKNKDAILYGLRNNGSYILRNIYLFETTDLRRFEIDVRLMGNYLQAIPLNPRISLPQLGVSSCEPIAEGLRSLNMSLFDVPRQTMEDAVMGRNSAVITYQGQPLRLQFQRNSMNEYELRTSKTITAAKQMELDFASAW